MKIHKNIKRNITTILLFLSFFFLLPYSASAETVWVTIDDISYYIDLSTSEARCTGISTTSITKENLVIASSVEYNGRSYPVTKIASDAFFRCKKITGSLVIPNSITTIEYRAFRECSGLTGKLVIPNSVTTIENLAFLGCSGFTGDLIIPNSVTTIGESAFSGCSGFTGNLVISNSVTTIKSGAFYGCSGLTGELVIPNSVKEIKKQAFQCCSSLGSLKIKSPELTIEYQAFAECGFTGSLSFPNSVITIGRNAFEACKGLTGSLTFDDRGEVSIDSKAFYGCSGFTGDLVIGNSVVSIGDNAFEGCHFSGNLKIGDSVLTIGDYAFKDCGFTGSLTLGKSLEQIGKEAFNGFRFFGELILPESLKKIGNKAFYGCNELYGSIILSDNVTSVGEYAFYGCAGLNGTLSLGKNIAGIGAYAFAGCYSLKGSIVLPEMLTNVNKAAFYNCSSLTGPLVIPSNVRYIDEYAFSNCIGLTGPLTIPENVISLGIGAFNGCSGFTGTLQISKVDHLNPAFSDCTGFNMVILPPNLEYIAYPFTNCNITKLISPNPIPPSGGFCPLVNIPDEKIYKATLYVPDESVERYSMNAVWKYFSDIRPMSEFNLVEPSNITIEPNQLEMEALSTAQLSAIIEPEDAFFKDITWSSSNSTVVSVNSDGMLTSRQTGEAIITATTSNGLEAECKVTVSPKVITVNDVDYLLCPVQNGRGYAVATGGRPDGEGTLSILGSVEYNMSEYTVESVGDYAFAGLSEIKKLNIPWKINELGTGAFSGCTSLVEVVVENPDVTTDEMMARLFCKKDVFLNAPINSVYMGRLISGAPFANHSFLTDLTLGKCAMEIENGAFAGCNSIRSIKSLSPVPPELDIYGFDQEIYDAVAPRVPDNNTFAYRKANGWNKFYEILGFNEIRPDGLELIPSELTLSMGDMKMLGAMFIPENATDKSLTWTSSNDVVCPVSWVGGVIASQVGTAIITATTWNNKTATCKIRVVDAPIPLTAFALEHTILNVQIGENVRLKAIYTPEEATDVFIEWTSDNDEIVVVNEAGIITALKDGTATITATTGDGFSASCIVNVYTQIIPTTGITLDQTELSIVEGDTATLIATIDPENATDQAITWSSSDESVATVEDGKVTAVAPGTTTITATTTNGLKAECTVTVTAKSIPATGITLDNTELSMVEGDTATLTATIAPENATDQTITWSTSDETVATVEDGKITAIAPGIATITATSSNGLTAECTVTVTAKVVLATSISIDKESIEGIEGTEIQLTATVLPDDATDKTVTWSSSDENIATVNETGLVTIHGIGSVTITATTNDGSNLSATCQIHGVSGIEAIIYQAGGADVFTASGVLLKLNADNEYLSTLGRGVYIIRAGGKTYKIVK